MGTSTTSWLRYLEEKARRQNENRAKNKNQRIGKESTSAAIAEILKTRALSYFLMILGTSNAIIS